MRAPHLECGVHCNFRTDAPSGVPGGDFALRVALRHEYTQSMTVNACKFARFAVRAATSFRSFFGICPLRLFAAGRDSQVLRKNGWKQNALRGARYFACMINRSRRAAACKHFKSRHLWFFDTFFSNFCW